MQSLQAKQAHLSRINKLLADHAPDEAKDREERVAKVTRMQFNEGFIVLQAL